MKQNDQCGIPDRETTGCQICATAVTIGDGCKSLYDDEEEISILSMCGDNEGETGEVSYPQCSGNRNILNRRTKRSIDNDSESAYDYLYEDPDMPNIPDKVEDQYQYDIYSDPNKCKTLDNPNGFECNAAFYLKTSGFMGGLNINHAITPDNPEMSNTGRIQKIEN